MDNLELKDLINQLPPQIKLGKNTLDLVIFGYRNEVMYCVLKHRINCGVYFKSKFISFLDGQLIDNLKKMYSFLKEEGFINNN